MRSTWVLSRESLAQFIDAVEDAKFNLLVMPSSLKRELRFGRLDSLRNVLKEVLENGELTISVMPRGTPMYEMELFQESMRRISGY
jgi:hypothetical protein